MLPLGHNSCKHGQSDFRIVAFWHNTQTCEPQCGFDAMNGCLFFLRVPFLGLFGVKPLTLVHLFRDRPPGPEPLGPPIGPGGQAGHDLAGAGLPLVGGRGHLPVLPPGRTSDWVRQLPLLHGSRFRGFPKVVFQEPSRQLPWLEGG